MGRAEFLENGHGVREQVRWRARQLGAVLNGWGCKIARENMVGGGLVELQDGPSMPRGVGDRCGV